MMCIDGTTNPPNVTTTELANPDAVITVSTENFDKLMRKKLNPMLAFTAGKIRMKGDMMAGNALRKIF